MEVLLLKSLWPSLSKIHRKHGLWLVALLILGSILELASVSMLLPTVQAMQNRAALTSNVWFQKLNSIIAFPTNDRFFIWVMSAVLVMFTVKSVALFLINRFQFDYFASVQADISHRIFAKYLASDYSFFFEANSADLVNSVTEDIRNVIILIIFSVVTIATELTVALPLVLFIGWLNPVLAGTTILTCGICFFFIRKLVSRRLKPLGAELQVSYSKLIQSVQEGVGGIKELKILARESFYEQTFDREASTYAYGLGRYLFLNSVPRQILELMFILLFLGALLAMTMNGGLNESLPMLAVYAAAAFRLIPGLNKSAGALNSINMGRASLKTIVTELVGTNEEEAKGSGGAAAEPMPFKSLAMEAVCFDFPNRKRTIQDMTFEVKAGEILGIIGASGSGKTTLMDLLLGLLRPTKGRILVNGADIHDDIRCWQAHIGYVTQNIFLVDASIRRNIALGVPEAEIDDKLVWEALKKANLEPLVQSLSQGLETQVGERGIKFSGGQRQRMGIARALYRDPPILVLDEATSALDGENEREILKEVSSLKGRKTIIIIAHRISSLSACDLIMNIELGRIESVKSYAEVAARHDQALLQRSAQEVLQ